MSAAAYFVPHLLPLVVVVGYTAGHTWVFGVVGWFQLFIPLLDEIVGLERREDPAATVAASGIAWRVAIWSFVPAYFVLVWCGLEAASLASLSTSDASPTVLQISTAVGAIGGMCAVPVAHELMHQSSRWTRAVAELVMTSLSYPHFCIEHVHGHHRNVGTPNDPATARLGESVYAFYPRAVSGSVASAWRLEIARLRNMGLGTASTHNRMLRYAALLAAVYALVYLRWGEIGVAYFILQSVIGFSVVEIINYVEHYGLTRREISPGRFEPVGAAHAWNSSHRISNWLLFGVARHSDHHCDSRRPFSSLRDLADAPFLPAGYFSMFLLALVPPLWHRVMDRRVDVWQRFRQA
jgi:alkane 1-monooxygenase